MVHSYLITLGGYNVGCAVKLVVITSVVTFCAQFEVTFMEQLAVITFGYSICSIYNIVQI